MAVKTKQPESPAQKNERLKKRKQVYIQTYRKGLFFNEKEKLIEWLKQDDVAVRVNKGGLMDDDKEFIQITIEGFIP